MKPTYITTFMKQTRARKSGFSEGSSTEINEIIQMYSLIEKHLPYIYVIDLKANLLEGTESTKTMIGTKTFQKQTIKN